MSSYLKLIVADDNAGESITYDHETQLLLPRVQAFFKKYHLKQKLQCACTRQTALLKIVPNKADTRFHVSRLDTSSTQHASSCFFYNKPYAVSVDGGTQPAIKITETKVQFTGNFGLKISSQNQSQIEQTISETLALDGIRKQTNSLQTLLRLLWIEARLHRCYKGAAKSWDEISARLSARVRDEKNRCLEINKQALSVLWCAPSEQRPVQRFGKPLWTCHKADLRTLVVGLLKSKTFDHQLERGHLELVGLDAPLLINKSQNASIEHSWSRIINIPGAAVVVIATVGYDTYVGGRDRHLVYDRIAFMAIAPSGVPVESSHELTMERHLADAARSFEKPLLDTDEQDTRPDFILTDTWPNTTIEVYGMNTVEYLERKAIKEAYYESLGNPHISWMPGQMLPPLVTGGST